MGKRRSYEIKQQILMVVREKSATYAQLERKVDTGYRSVKTNCDELSDYGYVSIERIEKHPKTGRPAYRVSLTERGQDFLRKRKNRPDGMS